MRYSILFVLVFAAAEVGCGAKLPSVKPFKMEIQQGNLVTSKMLLQLRPGMTRSQVRYIMGTPLIVDSFRDNRWDYFYELHKQGVVVEKRRVILDFDKDALVSVRGDVVPSSDQSAQEGSKAQDISKAEVAEPKHASWLDKLMFWKNEADKAPASTPAEVKKAAPAVAIAAAPAVIAPVTQGQSVEQAVVASTPAQTTPSASEGVASSAAVTEPALPLQVQPSSPSLILPTDAAAAIASGADSQASDPEALVLKQVQQSVALWVEALQRKDVAAYFSAYAPDFIPEGKLSKKSWQAQRKSQILAAQGDVAVEIEGLNIRRKNKLVIATFKQKYAAQNQADEVIKTLTMRFNQNKGLWLITQENTDPLKLVLPKKGSSQAIMDDPEGAAVETVPVYTGVAQSAQALVTDAGVELAVEAWARAWRNKNISAYLSAYDVSFQPEGFPNKSVWETQRKKSFAARKAPVLLELGPLKIERNADEARVTFKQKYASKDYREEKLSQLKLKFQPARHAWLITAETTVEQPNMPPVHQEILAPEGSPEHLDGLIEQIGF